MRWSIWFAVLLLTVAGCREPSNPSSPSALPEGDPGIPGLSDIFDGSSGAAGANPHFFFLTPIAPSTPSYSGIPLDDLKPVATVCPIETWDSAAEECGAPLVTFSMSAPNPDDRIALGSGSKYHVVWKTNDHPVVVGQVYRVAVSVIGQVLGYADIKAYDNTSYSGHHNTDPDYVAISADGSLNVQFRIEEGALESEYCDPDNIEDCDVAIFTNEAGGCLRVFDNPGQGSEALGSQACVPAGAAELGGVPVEGEYAVILTLEKDDVFQGGGSSDWQVPFFSDLKTDPPGINFSDASEGVDVVICQAVEGTGAIPSELHPFLRPFLIFSDGSIALPEQFTFGVPECEGFNDDHGPVASAPRRPGFGGLLTRVAEGISRIPNLLTPQPLHAFRRLHGGLNTTVYDTRGRDGGGDGGGEGGGEGENVAAMGPSITLSEEEYVVELGAVLDVDPESSTAMVPETGVVGSGTTILVSALNALSEPFPFEVPVQVDISGANTATVVAVWLGSGQYEAHYTPAFPGVDQLVVSIDGRLLPGPFQSEVLPVAASAEFTTFEVSDSEDGAPTTVTVTVLDGNQQPYLNGNDYPVAVEISVSETGSGTPLVTVQAEDDDGLGTFDGVYVASYTPNGYGSFDITVTVEGQPTGDSPETITTAPRPADANLSSVSVGDGVVDSPTPVVVEVVNTAGDEYVYGDIRPAVVEVTVSGVNSATFLALDPDLNGTYEGSYVPTFPGTDNISATINGAPVPGAYTSEVAPLSGDLVVRVDISGGAPSDGLPVHLYLGSGPNPFMTGTTDGSGVTTFADIDFGDYTVHLPKRDFDVDFQGMTKSISHDQAPTTVTFTGVTQAIPETARIWRIRDGGNGNAFQYMVGGRSWTSARNQVRSDVLQGVYGHLATIADAQENAFVANFFVTSPGLCPDQTNPKKCKYKGWIGLTDEVQEGTFQWVTGEPASFFSWPDGQVPVDRKGNLDHVEIDLTGTWGIVNGASSTNEGYFVEYEVVWPSTPPF